MKGLFLATALLSSLTGSAFAADAMMPEPAAPMMVESAGFDWSGFYAGLQLGGASGSVRMDDGCFRFDQCGDVPGSRYYSEPDLSGWEIGGHVGAAQQLGSIVLGVETDMNWSNVSGDAGFTYMDGDTGETGDGRDGETTDFTMNWDGSARVKVGVAVDRFMPYATAGIAYGQADIAAHRVFGPDNDPRDLDFDHSLNLLGYTAGIGAAYAVSDNLVLSAEGRYTVYGEQDTHADLPNDGETLVVDGPQLFSVRGGVSFKF